jgi:hypothetical protein
MQDWGGFEERLPGDFEARAGGGFDQGAQFSREVSMFVTAQATGKEFLS